MTDPFIPYVPRKLAEDRELADWVRAVHTMLEDLARDNAARKTNFNALLAKLDADVGINDTDYASTLGL